MPNPKKLEYGVHYLDVPFSVTDGPAHTPGTSIPWRHVRGSRNDGGYDYASRFVYLGEHGPGRFGFFLVLHNEKTKEARVSCGCRRFTYDQAMKHWAGGKTRPGMDDCDHRRPHHLALVKCAREIAKINGWKF